MIRTTALVIGLVLFLGGIKTALKRRFNGIKMAFKKEGTNRFVSISGMKEVKQPIYQIIIHYICVIQSRRNMKLNRIKAVLLEKGISQTWLAKKLNKSFSMVNAYACNRIQPNLEILQQIAVDPTSGFKGFDNR